MKYLRVFENFENSEYPYYLGKGRDYGIDDKSILHVTVYDVSKNDDDKYLKFKMSIDKKDLIFKKTSNMIEVWSRVDPGEHYKNETSVIVKSKKGSFFNGENYRGVILKEEF